MKGFATRAIHGNRARPEAYGALRTPVYDNVAFEHDSARSIQLAFEGRKPAHSYSRITNPTVEDFEQRLLLLSGGLAALAVSSGMAAIANTILTLAGAGTNIVTTRYLFGNTLALFEKTMRPWGMEVRYADLTEPAALERAIDDHTRAVFLESVTNPQLEVADCRALGEITRRRGIPLVLDNTVTTPYLFNAREAGVNIEVLSTTKYISGGATTVGGAIIDHGNFDWRKSPRLADRAAKLGKMAFMAALRQEIFRNLGSCLTPHNAYLQCLGLETLSLRIDRSCANAQVLAEFLARHPKVESVHYPGLPGSRFHAVADRQFGGRFGGLLTFDLASREACFAFMDRLGLIRRATNLNDNKTLILHPASTIFTEFSEDDKLAMGVRPTMLRLSVGIEDHEDLLEDLNKGFETP